MIAASSLNDVHGDCSGAAPPRLGRDLRSQAPSSLAELDRSWGPPAHPSAAPQGHRWSSRSLPSTKMHQKCLYGGHLPLPPGSLPCTEGGALGEGPGSGGQAGLRDMGTSWGWHQRCRSPDEGELGASPSLPGHRRSLQHPARHSRTCRGTPGTPRQRGAAGSRAPALLPRAGPAPLPSLRFIPHQLGPSASPKSALRDPQPPLARLPARASPAKSQRASPAICSEPAGSRHSINVLRQGLPFASKVPNSRGVGVVLTFMRYL